MYGFFVCVYISILRTCLMSTEARKGHHSPGTGVKEGCKPPCGYWELNLCTLKEQPVVLTTKPLLDPSLHFFKCYLFMYLGGIKAHVWRAVSNCESQFSSCTVWVLEIKFLPKSWQQAHYPLSHLTGPEIVLLPPPKYFFFYNSLSTRNELLSIPTASVHCSPTPLLFSVGITPLLEMRELRPRRLSGRAGCEARQTGL